MLFQRGGYRPSDKCDWLKLLTIALPLAVLAACAGAFFLSLALHWGFYVLLALPMSAALLLGLCAAWFFRSAHCRYPAVAGVCGILLGSVMFLGYYHCRFVALAGAAGPARIEALPEFIDFCLHHDVVHEFHGPHATGIVHGFEDIPKQNKEQPKVGLNCVGFVVDWLAAAVACGSLTFLGARRAYCDACSRWMVRKRAKAGPGPAPAVVVAVLAKKTAVLSALHSQSEWGWTFEVEYCPGRQDQAGVCPIFFTAKKSVLRLGHRDSVVLARQIPLSVEELAALAKALSFK